MEDPKTAVTAATDVVELSKGPPRDSVIAGKYRIESTLGFGAMGIVLAAHHLQLNERVAIKILRDDIQLEPEHVERFIREAQAAVRLKSENVARIDDVGMLPEGKPYMVMELLEGLDLGRLLQDAGQLAAPIAVDFVLQVCDALAEAHSIGIVHRDIKPTNLFVTSRRDGSPLIKVLDFGISKAASASDLSLTQTSSVLGTPAYMSPEQMRSARNADARSDIWSLGTVLYELVEGRAPFEADNFAELCVAVATENPRDMVKAPEIQPALARALAKAPEDRYQSIGEFADALAPHAPDPQRAQRQVNRIFRLLGKQPPHPGARDSTPVIVPLREQGAPLRAHTFTAEEASTIANAGPTIAGARRRPLWLLAAGLVLLAAGAAATVIVMTGSSHDDPGSAVAPGVAGSAAGNAAIAGSDTTIAAPGGSADALGSAGSALAGSASGSAAGSNVEADGSATQAGSADRTTHHAPLPLPPHRPPVRPPPHRPPPHHVPEAGSAAPQAGSAAPPRPKCDPFANPKGCPRDTNPLDRP